MAKIFLFNPPHPEGKGFTREGRCTQESGVWATQWPPVSLATTAAFLEREGHTIKVIDCPVIKLDRIALERLIEKIKPDFVFWNTATSTLNYDLDIAKSVKKAAYDSIVGVLGTHVTVLPEAALDNPYIDMVIRREPEETIKDVCSCEKGKWETVYGISYKDPNTENIHHNPDRKFLAPEDIPWPAWHCLDISPYRLPLKGRPFLIVAPIRGCPFLCNFCTASIYYGKRLRKRPVTNIVDEIEANIERFKVNDFFVWADTFTADKKYVEKFCREITARGLKISWVCNSRVDTVNMKMLSMMKKAGLWMISFGLESGSDAILKQTGKNITAKQSEIAVSMAHQTGIKTSGHFIFGLPGETEKSMRKTLAFALDLPLDIAQFYAAAPFPGTGLYRQALKSKWLRKDTSFSQNHAALDLPGLSAQAADTFRSFAYRKFYMRPKTLLNIFSMMEPEAIYDILANLKRFSMWSGLFK